MWQLDLLVHSNCILILFLWYLVHRLCFYCVQTNQQQLSKFQKVHKKFTKGNNYKNTPKLPWGNPFWFNLLDGVSQILLKMTVITKTKITSFGKVVCDHTARSRVLQIKNTYIRYLGYFQRQLLHAWVWLLPTSAEKANSRRAASYNFRI